MPWTTTIDARTGEKKEFFLDASFGCGKRFTTLAAGPNIAHRVWEVKWNRASHGESDIQSLKYGMYDSAATKAKSLRNRGYKPEIISHEGGTHTVVA